MLVLIDNGHGVETPGKRSPDGRLREWAWAREVAKGLEASLKASGIPALRIVAEDKDVSLTVRCKRANAMYMKDRTAVLVSLHVNAAGCDGQWHGACGFSVMVSPRGSKNSRRLAALIYDEMARAGLAGNRSVPACHYWEQNLAVCRDTLCPAVLTENLFQDNRGDVETLLSEAGKDKIIRAHLNALKAYYGK